MKKSLCLTFCLTLQCLCSLAFGATRQVLKDADSNALLESFTTGAKKITIGSSGTLEWVSGATLTGGSYLKSALGMDSVENTAISTWAGTANVTTLGTITTGVWHGTDIGLDYLAAGGASDGQILGFSDGAWIPMNLPSIVTVGVTEVSGGTSGRLLVNNAGVLGEMALGTGVATALGNAVNAASGFLTYDADLATWAGITPTANIQSLLASADHTLLYDAANSRVMINTATSQAAALTISTTVGGDDALILRDSTNGGNARFYFTTPIGGPPDLHIQSDRLYLNALTYIASISATDGTLEVCNGEVFKADRCYQFIVQTNSANTVVFNSGADLDTTIRPYAGKTLDLSPDGDPIKLGGNISVTKTIITAGTTGNQTINKTSGRVNFAAAATSLVVTNSYVNANSVIQCTIATHDSTMTSVSVVAGSGSFTIYANAAPTAECAVNFTVTN